MKTPKLIFTLLLFVSHGNFLFGNPLPPPKAIISEFKFENDSSWVMEISFQYGAPFYKSVLDSIFISSSSGISRIRLSYIEEGAHLFVITKDSLESAFTIAYSGDCIKLMTYAHHMSFALVDSVSFGQYPNSMFGILQAGYSITRINDYTLCKDKSPTIGSPNDTAGTCGTMKGFIFDINNDLVKSGNLFVDNSVILDGNGGYATAVFSRKFICTKIRSGLSGSFYNAASLSIEVEPDSVIERDIHLKDFIVEVRENAVIADFELTVINYPNPFNSSTNFFVRIPTKIRYKQGVLKIFSISGGNIVSLPIVNGSSIQWTGRNSSGDVVSSGTYFYQLLLDNKIYKNGSMVFLK